MTTGRTDRHIVRCCGCGGWITVYRLDTEGCRTCKTLAEEK